MPFALAIMVYSRDVRPHRQLALRWLSLPLTHPESYCKEVIPRPEGNSTETFSSQLPEQGAKEWKGGMGVEWGRGATLFLETRIQILLLLSPESPPSLPIDQCGG